jgi:penicillin-binding protein 2
VDAPEIAVAVLVEHGGGGGAVAAPLARRILAAYFPNKAKKAEKDVEGEDQDAETPDTSPESSTPE